MAESEEELKNRLMRVKEESEKAALKLNIQKSKIMASGPITSWQIEGEKVGEVVDFILLGSKITVDGDCSHEIKKTLAPWKKRYDKPAGGLSCFRRVWLCIPMNRSPPGSSVQEISQARILELVVCQIGRAHV